MAAAGHIDLCVSEMRAGAKTQAHIPGIGESDRRCSRSDMPLSIWLMRKYELYHRDITYEIGASYACRASLLPPSEPQICSLPCECHFWRLLFDLKGFMVPSRVANRFFSLLSGKRRKILVDGHFTGITPGKAWCRRRNGADLERNFADRGHAGAALR